MEKIIESLIAEIGENMNREGLKETPARVSRMYKELFCGYDENKKPKITLFNNEQIDSNQIIIDKGYFYSCCEHHMMPFFGDYYFAYIPGKKIIGLSKISRIVDYCASKMQVQERLTKEILDELESKLKPKGIAMIMSARHLCKEMRGVRKNKSEITTHEFRGAFTDSNQKKDLLGLIDMAKK